MTPHVVRKGAAFVLSAERAPGAPEAMYRVECMTCWAESSWVDNDAKPVEVWALEHARHHGLAHDRFLVTTQRHWRVDPVHPAAAAPGAPEVGEPQQPRASGAHARYRRPRPPWRAVFRPPRPPLVRVGRAVGAVLVSALALGALLSGVLPAARRGRHASAGLRARSGA